jgi:6-phosphofructokinase 1
MRIGVLTGGGDCPGLNAAIRAVAQRGWALGDDVFGIRYGWKGLLAGGDVFELKVEDIRGILHVGGTVLGTSRTNPARSDEEMAQVFANIDRYGLDGLVAIGGDDTLGVAAKLAQAGAKVVGIPKTIDNDLVGTDACIGFDTATAVITEALDRLHTTASSHHRVMILEVMGRDVGWLAVVGGMAGGADVDR